MQFAKKLFLFEFDTNLKTVHIIILLISQNVTISANNSTLLFNWLLQLFLQKYINLKRIFILEIVHE